MKIVILRGGSAGRKRPATPSGHPGTRERGVMAIGDGGGRWVLLNMSPSVAHQLDSDQRLDDHGGLHDADVRAVLLTDAQVDHVGGLLSLRDGAPIDLYATPAVFEELTTALPVLPVLQHYCGVHWHVVPVAGDRQEASFRVEGMPTLEFTAIATRAPAPPHLGRSSHQGLVGDSIALAVRDLQTGQRAFCAPGVADFGSAEADWMREADCLLLDGPPPPQPQLQQPHPNQPPPPDWLAQLGALPARHKVLFAPAPAPSAERWSALGIAEAYDGMAIEL